MASANPNDTPTATSIMDDVLRRAIEREGKFERVDTVTPLDEVDAMERLGAIPRHICGLPAYEATDPRLRGLEPLVTRPLLLPRDRKGLLAAAAELAKYRGEFIVAVAPGPDWGDAGKGETFRATILRGPVQDAPGHDARTGSENGGGEGQLPRVDILRALLRFIFSDGPHPRSAARRLYFIAHTFAPEHIVNMTEADLAELFGEGKANVSAAINRLFGDIKANIPGHKSRGARRTYARIRKGNRNRAGGSVKITEGITTPFQKL